MSELFSIQNLGNLGVLIFLQAVLGFDNLLYISLESKRAPAHTQASVRRNGILIALALRVVLLFVMIMLIDRLKDPFFSIHWKGVLEGDFNFSTIVFLLGGGFIMYTAVKEISHMLAIEDLEHGHEKKDAASANQVIVMIVIMNLVFSFDSILSALAITDVFFVLATAIFISGMAMLLLADRVSEFLAKNRKYEVLGLFILLIVGVVLLGEGGHVAHLKLFGYSVEPLSKTTFYFSVVVLVAVDIIQSGYQKKLAAERARVAGKQPATS
ncbi:MAG: tellurium resistance protein TerC [Myxococcota bacterium]